MTWALCWFGPGLLVGFGVGAWVVREELDLAARRYRQGHAHPEFDSEAIIVAAAAFACCAVVWPLVVLYLAGQLAAEACDRAVQRRVRHALAARRIDDLERELGL